MSARRLFYASAGALRAPWRLAIFLLIAAGASAAIGAVLSVLFYGPLPGARIRGEDLYFEASLGSWALMLGIASAHVIMVRLVDPKPWSELGLGREQSRLPWLGLGFLLGAAAIGLPSSLLLAVDWLESSASVAATTGGWWQFALLMAIFLLPAALMEELLFRGYPFALLRETLGWRAALAITSAVFGLLHVRNPGAGAQPLLMVVLAGVFLGGVLLATGSLYAAWMAHFAWNWTMAALLHADVSGFLPVAPPGYRVTDSGPDWATGGSWGPEGGVGAALGMALGLTYLCALARHRQRVHRTA